MHVGDRLIDSERERARMRHQHREMMKMVDDLRAQVRHLEAF
jgi:ethanolamine utilization protein EutA (predicted chaperonin)